MSFECIKYNAPKIILFEKHPILDIQITVQWLAENLNKDNSMKAFVVKYVSSTILLF